MSSYMAGNKSSEIRGHTWLAMSHPSLYEYIYDLAHKRPWMAGTKASASIEVHMRPYIADTK